MAIHTWLMIDQLLSPIRFLFYLTIICTSLLLHVAFETRMISLQYFCRWRYPLRIRCVSSFDNTRQIISTKIFYIILYLIPLWAYRWSQICKIGWNANEKKCNYHNASESRGEECHYIMHNKILRRCSWFFHCVLSIIKCIFVEKPLCSAQSPKLIHWSQSRNNCKNGSKLL